MFEHALLDSGPAPDKRRAIALAFLGQAGLIASLIVVSVFYADRIVPVHLMHLVAPPIVRAVPEPEVKPQHSPASSTISVLLARPQVFQAPTRMAQRIVPDTGDPDIAPPTNIQIGGNTGSSTSAAGSIFGNNTLTADAPPRDPEPAKPVQKAPTGPIRVSSGVASAMLLHKVTPIYPALAKQARISGEVRLTGIIGRDGHIQQLQVISGHPLLINAALEAVRQWVYRPTLLNGEPVDVIAPISVNFVLN